MERMRLPMNEIRSRICSRVFPGTEFSTSTILPLQWGRKRGFTLIELLVVIGIIAILAALLTPMIRNALESAKKGACLSNVHQISIGGSLMIEEDGDFVSNGGDCDDIGKSAVALLPYMTETFEVFDCSSNRSLIENSRTEMTGSGMPSGVHTEYEINGYLISCGSYTRRDVLIEEPSQVAFAYDYPWDADSSVGRAHDGGINVGFLDGHTTFLEDGDFGSGDTLFSRKGHDFDDAQGVLPVP